MDKYARQKQRYREKLAAAVDEIRDGVEGTLIDRGFYRTMREDRERGQDAVAIYYGRTRAELRGDYDAAVLDAVEAELREASINPDHAYDILRYTLRTDRKNTHALFEMLAEDPSRLSERARKALHRPETFGERLINGDDKPRER